MPLTLVTGPANSGKAGRVLGAFRARLGEDPLLVVPRAEDVDHSRRELAAQGAVLGARVLRFSELFDLIGERAAESGGARRASAVQRLALMEEAVRRTRLRVLHDSAQAAGFARAAARFAAELERAGVEPDRLRRAVAASGRGGRGAPAGDLAAVYGAYRAALDEAGLAQPELLARRAVDALRRDPARWGGTPVFAYGFDDFTDAEQDALEALSERAGAEVTVSLPYERGRAAFKAVSPAFTRLAGMAREHVELEPTGAHYAPAARAALHHVERELFGRVAGAAPAGPPPDPGGAVRLHLAGGERAEVELAAAEAARLLREGLEPGEVAVVFRDPGRLATLVEAVFGAYGIPFSLVRRLPLAHTGLGRGLLALLRCADGTGTPADLVAYLRTPARVREPGLVDRLESRIRRDGLRTLPEARAAWERMAWPLGELDRLAAAGGARLVSELDARLERLFGAPYRGAAHVLAGPELEDARAYAAARDALAGLRGLAVRGGPLRLDRARLHDLLAATEVRAGEEPGPDRVRVAAPEELRARRFGAVIVCGLQEGEFPRAGAPDAFLPDELRADLNRAGGLRLPPRAGEADRERLLFYACASRAERLLVLSARVSDEEGAPAAPSPLIDDVRALFAPGALDATARRRTLGEVVWPAEAAPTGLEWERALALGGPREEPQPPGPLTAPEVLSELAGRRDFSAGALETFAGCGVKWLVEKLLDLKPLEPDGEPLARGRLAHDVLRTTLERLREATGSARVTPESLPEAERLAAAAVAEQAAAHRLGATRSRVAAAARRLEHELVRHLRHEAASGSRFEPERLEAAFGFGDDGDALPALELPEAGARLRGRIDRVDRLGDAALVRDYKGGSAVTAGGRWAEERRLQAPLYLLAARELLGLRPAGALYVPLAGDARTPRGAVAREWAQAAGDDVHEGDLVEADELDRLLGEARATAIEAIGRIRAGDVRPCPGTCAWNGGCSYPSICRVEGA